jgi:YHS domain-containing protein
MTVRREVAPSAHAALTSRDGGVSGHCCTRQQVLPKAPDFSIADTETEPMPETARRFAAHLLAMIALVATLSAASLAAADKPAIYSASGKLAVKGADVVAYFTERRAVIGKAEHSTTWHGATWRFSSAENLAKFKANPEKYAPQYGGYCAYAVSEGYTAKIEPEAWSIVNGKLYLNYSLGVRSLWDKNKKERIRKADTNWPDVLKR